MRQGAVTIAPFYPTFPPTCNVKICLVMVVGFEFENDTILVLFELFLVEVIIMYNLELYQVGKINVFIFAYLIGVLVNCKTKTCILQYISLNPKYTFMFCFLSRQLLLLLLLYFIIIKILKSFLGCFLKN